MQAVEQANKSGAVSQNDQRHVKLKQQLNQAIPATCM
jgi:hypothetical protein